jgi:hypothetical protein
LLLQLSTLLIELLLHYLIAVGVSIGKPGNQTWQNQKYDSDHACLHFFVTNVRTFWQTGYVAVDGLSPN